MEYKLCKDNMICCGTDCMRCANLVYDALTNENKNLKMRLDKLTAKFDKLAEEKNGLQLLRQMKSKENKELIDKCQELEEQLECANKDIESLNNKNWDYGFQIMYKDRKIMELEEKCEQLVMENDKLRTMNSDLLYRNGLLMKTTAPTIFQHSYGELSDKIEGLKEDIIRLDKCLSRRPCVKMEREEEE